MFLSLQRLSEITGFSQATIRARCKAANVFSKGRGKSITYSSHEALRAVYYYYHDPTLLRLSPPRVQSRQ